MFSILKESKTTLVLAFPIMAGQLSQMLLGLADTLMIGRVGTDELAASAFANVLFYIPFVFAIGLSVAVSVQVSHSHGKNAEKEAGESFRHGFIGSIILGFVLAAGVLAILPILEIFRQPPEVTALVPSYLFWIALSFIPAVPSLAIKSFAEAKNKPWPVLWLMLSGVLLNIILNYALIFGHWGAPEMGLTGAGIATCLARFYTCLILWIYVNKSHYLAPSMPQRWCARLDKSETLTQIKLASPVSVQLLMEFGAFSICALLIGLFGSVPLAAHQIALTCAGSSFMLPLGLSMAVTIRVGHCMGAGEANRCKQLVLGAHGMALMITGFFAISYIVIGDRIAQAFTYDQEVIALTASLFVVVAFFQVSDGVQIISMGALRGLRDVNIPTFIIFASFWVIGIPAGAIMAFKSQAGPVGLWIGLAIGISITGTILTLRLVTKLKNSLRLAAF